MVFIPGQQYVPKRPRSEPKKMVTATNVDAKAVSTIEWLSTCTATIVVPVYQRQYRWDIGGCEQLLADIRAVADADENHRHFLGSILSTANPNDGAAELVLIDGQQRITTLMLLIAALHHTVQMVDPELAAELGSVLVHTDDPTRTKLRPHRAWAEVFDSVVLDRRLSEHDARDSRFDDNYAFFRSQVRIDEVSRIWRGLKKLEHVAISLGPDSNAQQIFESLNSTGEPLRDHELIHNYLLMGLTHAQQNTIEDQFWIPIERNTGEAIGKFWYHYLVMVTGRELELSGGRGVYDAFRQHVPMLDFDTLLTHAGQWREYSAIYSRLLDPSLIDDTGLSSEIVGINVFGRGMYPLVMRSFHENEHGRLTTDELMADLSRIQSLLIRREVVGLTNDRLVARLCRAQEAGPDNLIQAIARIMPSDQRVRVALKYAELPHPLYVLARLENIDVSNVAEEYGVDHIVPLSPSDTWSGDGVREWAEFSEDEQNSHRALSPTLGNLALLEEPLAERAFGGSFLTKRDAQYATSDVITTRSLAGIPAWSTAAITARTATLTSDFLRLWEDPVIAGIDDDGLTPILDAHRRRGWPAGWQREFDYVEYCGEHWEVHDVKALFDRVFKRLWADARESVLTFSDRRGGPIFDAQAWRGEWQELGEDHHLYLGWDSRYMMTALQGVLTECDLAAEVFVKYSYIGDAM